VTADTLRALAAYRRQWASTKRNMLGLARTSYLNAHPRDRQRICQRILAGIRQKRPAITRAVSHAELAAGALKARAEGEAK